MPVDLLRAALPRQPDPDLAQAALRPRIAHAALDALAAARARPSHATPILSRYFRENRGLGSKERPVASEAVYGVIRHEALLDRAGASDDEGRLRLWARLMEGERFEDLPSQGDVPDLATALGLPEAVAGEWLEGLGLEGAAALAAAMAERAPLTLRINRQRTDRDRYREILAEEGVQSEPCAQVPDGLRVLSRVNAGALPGVRDGLFEVQDEASQRLVTALAPLLAEVHHALDLCAGAGGKTLAMAALGARVQAWDARSHALDELSQRARRAGVERLVRVRPPEPAPLVLVDAPCSTVGRLRRDPALRWGFDPGRHVQAQRALLAQGAALVEPGGWLVYATCSLLQVENGHTPPGDWTVEGARTLWPHVDGTDGFFWSVWRRP